jgi:ATP synthase mitochondrial F1 complex assembly factor 2
MWKGRHGYYFCFKESLQRSPIRQHCASFSGATLLGGRSRFYKYVGVTAVDPPWEEKIPDPFLTVDSPIAAGVDGTQSASVVQLKIPENEIKKKLLFPQKQGSKDCSKRSDWFGVTLDGRIVKTPLGQTLAIPSESLAWAIAAEWDSQETYLRPAQMPLMTLVCTALDQTTASPDTFRSNCLKYLSTDTTCYWSEPEEDRDLHKKQEQSWTAIHEHCQQILGGRVAISLGSTNGILLSRANDTKSIGLPHPPIVFENAHRFVHSLDAWHLTALSSAATEAKSMLCAMSLMTGGLSPKDAVRAARIEEEFQIEIWGMVEGQHDYDRLNCSIQMHAAHFLFSSITVDNQL